MQRNSAQTAFGLALSFIIIVFGSYVIVAQTEITGAWTASSKQEKRDKIYIQFERQHRKGGKNQHGTGYSFDEIQGLTRDQAVNGKVSFRLVREAGTVECDGSFNAGKGSGTFRFAANRGFIDSMRSRGFDFEKRSSEHNSDPEEKLFSAALLNVTTALADDLRSANFPDLDVDDLFKAAIFKIDGKFMAEMKATGFPNLTMEDLVKARIFKIDAAFVRNIKDTGFGADNFEHLVKYSIFKVTPEFLGELKAEGLTDLTAEQVVQLRIFKIDAAFVRQARAEDPNITVERMVQKKIGVRSN